MLFSATVFALHLGALACATPLLWDGRAPYNYTETDVDESFGPYLRLVVQSH